MSADLQLTLPATEGGLLDGLSTIERYCLSQNIARAAIARLRILIEELFTNTIKYGYRGASDSMVRLGLTLSPSIMLIYEDDAPPFDPTAWDTESVLNADAEERIVGQTGIALILGLAASTRYIPRASGNRLEILLAPYP